MTARTPEAQSLPVTFFDELATQGNLSFPPELQPKLTDVIAKIQENGVRDVYRIKDAIYIAHACEQGTLRDTGGPSIEHQLEVIEIVASLGISNEAVYLTAALHDTPENTAPNKNPVRMGNSHYSVRAEELGIRFGGHVGRDIDFLSKVKKANDADINDKTYLKIFESFARSVDVILIKLADRLHNMRTIRALSSERQLKKAKETLLLYVKLAHKLGLHAWANELAAHSLLVLSPSLAPLLARYHEAYPPEFFDNLYRDISQNTLWEGLPKGSIIFFRPPQTSNQFDDPQYPGYMDFLYRHYRGNGEKMNQETDTCFIPCDIIVPDTGQNFHFTSSVHEFLLRLASHTDFLINEEEVDQALAFSTFNGDAVVFEARDPAGRVIQFRFIPESGVTKERASVADLYTESKESVIYQEAEEKLKKLGDTIVRIEKGKRYAKDIVKEFMRNLDLDYFTITSHQDNKEYYFPRGARVIDFAYAAGEKIGHRTVHATIIVHGVPYEHQPLDAELPDGCRVELHLTGSEIVDPQFVARLDMTVSEYTRELIAARIKDEMATETHSVKTPLTDLIQKRGLKVIKNELRGKPGAMPDHPFLGIRYANPWGTDADKFRYFLQEVGLKRIEPEGRRKSYFQGKIQDILRRQGEWVLIELELLDTAGSAGKILSLFEGYEINIRVLEVAEEIDRLSTARKSSMKILISHRHRRIFQERISEDIKSGKYGTSLRVTALKDLV